jgi:hypothetical protein
MANRKIIVLDNFLNPVDFATICDTILNSKFTWNFQFCHLFFKLYPKFYVSPYFSLLSPMLERLKTKSLLRIKANLNVPTDKPIEHCYHTDVDGKGSEDYYSALLYLNDNNGGTKIKDQPFIQSKANRVLIFPSNIEHTGVSQTDTKHRVLINTIFTKKDG